MKHVILQITITTIFTIFLTSLTTPTLSLECYKCEPCNNIGQKVTCPATKKNCLVAFGYLENLVGIKKGCSDLQPSPFGTAFCDGYTKETFQGYEFSNATGCLCGLNDCNSQILPPGYQYRNLLKFAEEMASNLKCWQCNPCTDEGVEVLCPNGVLNCFQTTGLLKGKKALMKGCEDPTKTTGKQGALSCKKEASITVFNQTLTGATNCLCEGEKCNVRKPTDPDDVVPTLKCYTCNGACNGAGTLTSCSDTTLNCYVGQGKENDTGNSVTIRGCGEPALTPVKLPVKTCKLYSEYTVATKTYTQFTFCVCSTEGCNDNTQIGPPPTDGSLKCYQCDPCVDDGVLAVCPKDTLNCIIGMGMKDGKNVTIKACAGKDITPVKLETTFCSQYDKYKLQSVVYDNVTACACSVDGCNKDFSGLDGGGGCSGGDCGGAGGGDKGLLRCYECSPCTDEGIVVKCPASTLNCYYFEGLNQTSKSGEKVIGKGCASPEMAPGAVNPKQCFPFSTYTLNGTTFTNVKACACATNMCNDELKPKLECYECERCRGDEKVVTCASNSLNCYVMSGKLGLFEFSSRGCSADLPFRVKQPVCTKYSTIELSDYTFRKAIGCVCSTSKCNQPTIPAGALYNEPSHGNMCVSGLFAFIWAFVFSAFFFIC